MAHTQAKYFPLGGGLDVVTPALSVNPGKCLVMVNYEPWFNGGYRRINGYERFDGRPKPSEQTFTGFNIDTVAGLSIGTVVTGDTSGTTGVVIGIWDDDGTYGSDAVGVTKVSGSGFLNGEDLNTGSYTIGSDPVLLEAPNQTLEDIWLLEAQDDYRDDIAVVPGANAVNGVWQRDANVYAIRDNVGETAGILHLASASGWTTTGITLAEYIFFDAGVAAGATVQEGDTLTGAVSGATGTIHRIVLNGGSVAWDGSGEGYFVLTGVAGGPFQNNEALESPAATTVATADGVNATFAFSTGGHYRFHNHNFFGGSATYRTYGVNGVDAAFEIDENNIVSPIFLPTNAVTGQPATESPFLIEEHRGYLFLAYPDGSLVHTVVGEPMVISGFLGSVEFGIGDDLTGLESVVGGVLVITTERETRGLYGIDPSDWDLRLIATKSGGKLYSTRKLDTVYSLDDLGITSINRTDAFGDFVGATVSQLIQPIVDNLRNLVTDATVVRASNQYRVYFSDNSGLVMYVPGPGQSERSRQGAPQGLQFGFIDYPVPVSKIYNTEDENGVEITYFASDDGFVRQDQIGNNFDGGVIRSYLRTIFTHLGSPSYRKRFRRLILELTANKPLALKIITDLSFGAPEISSGSTDIAINAGGGFWDTDNWDEFFWDGQNISTTVAKLSGTGENVSFLIYNESAVTRPFILQGMTVHFDLRRLQR